MERIFQLLKDIWHEKDSVFIESKSGFDLDSIVYWLQIVMYLCIIVLIEVLR